ncbi:UNVERIFIED_CONTAM: hypothetical protein HDU68_009574 [Siphonaria sp. JEL0065]|nr:hypothetical protein HDU68_009574 [Siphonaria sp. JEL0065]
MSYQYRANEGVGENGYRALPYELYVAKEGYKCVTNAKETSPFTYDPSTKNVTFSVDAYATAAKLKAGLLSEGVNEAQISYKKSAVGPAMWVVLSDEQDFTQKLNSEDRHITLATGGTMFEDFSVFDGILIKSAILEYRPSVGKPPKAGKGKYARAKKDENIYGKEYLSIGIPEDIGNAVKDYITHVHGLTIDDKSFGNLQKGYYWQSNNADYDKIPCIVMNDRGEVKTLTPAHALEAAGKHLIGDAHFIIKTVRGSPFDNPNSNPPTKVTFTLAMFQIEKTTSIGPAPIGNAKSTGAIVGGAVVKDSGLFNVLTRGSGYGAGGVSGSTSGQGGAIPVATATKGPFSVAPPTRSEANNSATAGGLSRNYANPSNLAVAHQQPSRLSSPSAEVAKKEDEEVDV